MEVKSEWLSQEGFDQIKLKSRPREPSQSFSRVSGNFYSTVKHQDYSASVWLRRKEKLEHSQQRCIVIFALVCCFAILVALIFSAVDIVGEDEDGISEENCQKKCRITLVENIPDGLVYSENATFHLSLFHGWMNLLNIAEKCVDIVSSSWDLCSHFNSRKHPAEPQVGRLLCKKLQEKMAQNVELKLLSDVKHNNSEVLQVMKKNGAEIQFLNMTPFIEGHVRSSFWIVDKKHVYIGSAHLDKESLGQMKELGVILYNCSCLVLDLQRIFNLYSSLKYKDSLPQTWSRKLYGLFGVETALKVQLNGTDANIFVSNSPKSFCPSHRVLDVDAIYSVIDEAQRFIYVSVMDYLPLINKNIRRYWSDIDGKLREALVLRKIKVRLLISCWKNTDQLTYSFLSSLKSLCNELPDCSLEVKFFVPKEQLNGSFPKINRNKYVVTDRSAYIGNFDWVGDYFTYDAGAGLVIKATETSVISEKNETSILDQLKAVFERDWYSRHARSLQGNKILDCMKQKLNRPPINKTAGNYMALKDNFIV